MALGRTLGRLKAETASRHLTAETHVRILDPDATVEDYAAYLLAMRGIHGPVESRFAVHDELRAAGFAPEMRCKRSLIDRDIAALGIRPSAVALCSLPDATSLPRAIGIAYVVEGSTLGGRFILAKLPPRLQPLVGRATAFLDGYGPATGARWRSFAELVARTITTAADEDHAINSACEMFDCLTHHLQRVKRPLALGRAS